MIGSSGQTVQDILRFTNLDDPIDIMDNILDWGHQIPSAPDTIRKYHFKIIELELLHRTWFKIET